MPKVSNLYLITKVAAMLLLIGQLNVHFSTSHSIIAYNTTETTIVSADISAISDIAEENEIEDYSNSILTIKEDIELLNTTELVNPSNNLLFLHQKISTPPPKLYLLF
ncbi:MAG: hypothetical protein KAG84_05525 [Bacteroidales bacterium]|nr:hypothetical protein [Bacteroidales bacterium]